MEQFKHTGQLLFNATFFFSSSHAHMQLTQTEGWGVGLVQSVRTYGLICYSLLDRDKTEGEKVLIFCQYGCVLILGPHSFSSLRCGGGGGGGGVSHLFCQFPWQRGSSKSEEVRPLVRGESGFTEINITWNALHNSLSVGLSVCPSPLLSLFKLRFLLSREHNHLSSPFKLFSGVPASARKNLWRYE